MAKTWTNTVPQGLAGTGNAVIYGPNTAIGNFNNQLANYNEQLRINELRKQQQAQSIADSFRKNMLTASNGRLWSDQIGKIEQDVFNEGADLVKQGIDPYRSLDPKALSFQEKQRNAIAIQGYREALEKQYNDINKSLASSDIGEYDPESIKAVHDFINNTNLQEAYSRGYSLPSLQKAFRPDQALKGFRAITTPVDETVGNIRRQGTTLNKEATERAILSTLSNSPGGQRYLDRLTGGIPIADINSFPDTIEGNKQDIISAYEGDPNLRNALAQQNILPNTPQFDQFVDELARTRKETKDRVRNTIDGLVNQSTSGMKLGITERPDFTLENQQMSRERMQLSREAAHDRQIRLNKFLSGKEEDNDREKWIQDIQSGKDVAIKSFDAAMQEIGGKVSHENGITTVTIPFTQKTKNEFGETVEVPRQEIIRVGKATGQAGRIRINALLNRLKSVGTKKQLDVEGYNYDDSGWNTDDTNNDEGLLN